MRILITGGAGFVGSHLADELLSRGHRVHALDDLSTGAIDNVRHLKAHPAFEYTIESEWDVDLPMKAFAAFMLAVHAGAAAAAIPLLVD